MNIEKGTTLEIKWGEGMPETVRMKGSVFSRTVGRLMHPSFSHTQKTTKSLMEKR